MATRAGTIAGLGLLMGLGIRLAADLSAQQSDRAGGRWGNGTESPPISRYYEARLTPEGYAIYVPFFITKQADPDAVAAPESGIPEPGDGPTTATASVVELLAGVRTREEIVPGEYIQVYRPAVYELDAEGREKLIGVEAMVTLPKLRIIVEEAGPAEGG